MPTIVRVGLVTVTWLSVLLRYRSLFANRFHADEALFASWARHIAVWRDPLLLTQPVDKPPLLFYLQALFYPLMGPVEWAARLPNLVVSILIIPLAGVLAWRLYRRGAAVLLAALFVAVAPLAIQFSATAFTDPLLTFWLTAALYVALAPAFSGTGNGRSLLLSGLLFGLALSTKHQAWLFLPLFIAVAWQGGWSRRMVFRWLGRRGGRLDAPGTVVVGQRTGGRAVAGSAGQCGRAASGVVVGSGPASDLLGGAVPALLRLAPLAHDRAGNGTDCLVDHPR